MRDKVTSKLKSKSGASLSFALLFFVVCATFAALIFASAYATVGRVTGRLNNPQKDYAIYSAADVIADQIRGQKSFIIEERWPMNGQSGADTSGEIPEVKYYWYYDKSEGEERVAFKPDEDVNSLIIHQLSTIYEEYLNVGEKSLRYTYTLDNLSLSSTYDETAIVTMDFGDQEVAEALKGFTIEFKTMAMVDAPIDVTIYKTSEKNDKDRMTVHVYCTPTVEVSNDDDELQNTDQGQQWYVKKQTVSYDNVDVSAE